jgi:hypothetical protein
MCKSDRLAVKEGRHRAADKDCPTSSQLRRCDSSFYARARTSQTIKQISTRVPIKPYPNIVASTETNPRIQNTDASLCTTGAALYVPFGTQSTRTRGANLTAEDFHLKLAIGMTIEIHLADVTSALVPSLY